jgi:hypothetical protein
MVEDTPWQNCSVKDLFYFSWQLSKHCHVATARALPGRHGKAISGEHIRRKRCPKSTAMRNECNYTGNTVICSGEKD